MQVLRRCTLMQACVHTHSACQLTRCGRAPTRDVTTAVAVETGDGQAWGRGVSSMVVLLSFRGCRTHTGRVQKADASVWRHLEGRPGLEASVCILRCVCSHGSQGPRHGREGHPHREGVSRQVTCCCWAQGGRKRTHRLTQVAGGSLAVWTAAQRSEARPNDTGQVTRL